MKVTLTTGEAIRLASKQLFECIGEDVIVDLVHTEGISIKTMSTSELQDIWTQNIAPISLDASMRPAVIGLIKLYRGLHLELTGHQASLADAKIFVETHTRH